jgi:hypothetical protein
LLLDDDATSLVGPAVLEKVVRYVVTNGQVEVDGQILPEAKQKKYASFSSSSSPPTELLSNPRP